MSERKSPYVIKEQAGTKAYCACGKSENLPYCDGSHTGTDITPHIVKLDEEKTVAICGCRKSGNLPHCDGTHSSL